MFLTMDGNSMPKFLNTRNDSDAKVGQFFSEKRTTRTGISASAATGFLTEKGEVIPFEPKDKALAKLKRIS